MWPSERPGARLKQRRTRTDRQNALDWTVRCSDRAVATASRAVARAHHVEDSFPRARDSKVAAFGFRAWRLIDSRSAPPQPIGTAPSGGMRREAPGHCSARTPGSRLPLHLREPLGDLLPAADLRQEEDAQHAHVRGVAPWPSRRGAGGDRATHGEKPPWRRCRA